VLLGASVALAVVAARLRAHRDLQAGLIQPSPGPARASSLLTMPVGLSLRLQRATFAAWAGGLFITGVAYGSLGNSVADMVDTSEQLRKIFIRGSADVVDAYFSTTSLVLALAAAGFAIQATLRLRGEESTGRAEPLLATALSRGRWAVSHLTVSIVGGLALVAIAGLGAGIAYAFEGGGWDQPWRLAWAGIVRAPAVWSLSGLALALVGLAPKAAGAVWAVLGFCVVEGFLGPLLGLPGWVDRLSPFDHVPNLPVADLRLAPLSVLTAIAAGLAIVGLAALRRRDLT
jgi:ABC-2 type transport system permease protein